MMADHAQPHPSLMTTNSIIAGILPMLSAKRDGSLCRTAMMTIVVGGQTPCLLLTLIATPVISVYFAVLQSFRLGEAGHTPRLFRGATALDSFAPCEFLHGEETGRPAEHTVASH